ncbi:MAG: exonuclease domain-containing protein [Betaproteobacteria bacterium]
MSARIRFILAVAVLGLLMTGPFVVTAALVWLDMRAPERELLVQLLVPRLPLGALLTAAGFAIGLVVVSRLFRQYVQGLLRMAEHLRLMLSANRDLRVVPEGPPEVRQLAEAANALAEQRNQRADAVDVRIAEAKASLEAEKNRLAALMSELAMAVVVCNPDGLILLYNHRARSQFRASGSGDATGGEALVGLGRSVFDILEHNQIDHALGVAWQRRNAGKSALASFVAATRGGQLLRVQLVPVVGAEANLSGYVLSMEDITRSMEEEAARDHLIHDLTEGTRGALGAIRAAAANLVDYPEMEAAQRERFVRIIADEAAGMGQRLNRTLDRFSDALKTRWPLEDALGVDIVAAAARRVSEKVGLPARLDDVDDSLWIRVDSYALVFAIAFVAERLKEHYGIRELRFRLGVNGRFASLDLVWMGSNVSPETFYAWELEAMQAGGERTPLTLREVIERHGGEFWCQREKAAAEACFRLMLPLTTPERGVAPPAAAGRPEYYDFDLFEHRDSGIDLDRPLSELAFTIFDTETTGLDPKSDEIIQIGAIRMVNGRLLRQETFDRLIDPRRPVRPESFAIHGIDNAMLEGSPGIETVLPAFHRFAAGTVLVGHNAAFDMRFLGLKAPALEIVFNQPVLDTLLLSAVLHPHQESHRLEAIAERLGVRIEVRHRALEDALATGEIFLKLLPLLREKRIVTLRQALEVSRQTYLARIEY